MSTLRITDRLYGKSIHNLVVVKTDQYPELLCYYPCYVVSMTKTFDGLIQIVDSGSHVDDKDPRYHEHWCDVKIASDRITALGYIHEKDYGDADHFLNAFTWEDAKDRFYKQAIWTSPNVTPNTRMFEKWVRLVYPNSVYKWDDLR